MTGSEFTVVSMMRETRSVAARFIEYYLKLGASRIEIFFDGDPTPVAHLASEKVRIHPCDENLWRQFGVARPGSVEKRQWHIALNAFRAIETDWMLHVDADEFVFADQPMRNLLSAVPDDVEVLRLPTAEAVWCPSDSNEDAFTSTGFRTALPSHLSKLRRVIYPLHHGLFSPQGIIGHVQGKIFIRKGTQVDALTCHNALRKGQKIGSWASDLGPTFQSLHLGHFDAVSFDHWQTKWRRRTAGESIYITLSKTRLRQMQTIERALHGKPSGALRMFRKLYRLSPIQFAILRSLGCAFRRDIFAEMGMNDSAICKASAAARTQLVPDYSANPTKNESI
ncbi:MAG: glycosyltransferase family 2 protein [Pseudomonadota bacterium]